MTVPSGTRTPVRLFITNNLNLATALVASGLRLRGVQRDDSVLVDFLLEDPSDRGTELSQKFYERRLNVDALSLLDARALLMGQARRHEVRG